MKTSPEGNIGRRRPKSMPGGISRREKSTITRHQKVGAKTGSTNLADPVADTSGATGKKHRRREGSRPEGPPRRHRIDADRSHGHGSAGRARTSEAPQPRQPREKRRSDASSTRPFIHSTITRRLAIATEGKIGRRHRKSMPNSLNRDCNEQTRAPERPRYRARDSNPQGQASASSRTNPQESVPSGPFPAELAPETR